MKPCEMASLNYRLQNQEERQNRSTNNGDMDERAKRPVKEWVCYIFVIRENLSLQKLISFIQF